MDETGTNQNTLNSYYNFIKHFANLEQPIVFVLLMPVEHDLKTLENLLSSSERMQTPTDNIMPIINYQMETGTPYDYTKILTQPKKLVDIQQVDKLKETLNLFAKNGIEYKVFPDTLYLPTGDEYQFDEISQSLIRYSKRVKSATYSVDIDGTYIDDTGLEIKLKAMPQKLTLKVHGSNQNLIVKRLPHSLVVVHPYLLIGRTATLTITYTDTTANIGRLNNMIVVDLNDTNYLATKDK